MATDSLRTSSVASSFPCLLPEDELLTLSTEVFEQTLIQTFKISNAHQDGAVKDKRSDPLNDNFGNTFMKALDEAEAIPRVSIKIQELAKHDKTLTENGDVAFSSTGSALLDLFVELGRDIPGPRLEELLDAAWTQDSQATLKIVWNARSIHLGKGEHDCFYKSLGWLKKNHPATLLLNLQWLVRSVIELKPEKAKDAAVMVEKEDTTTLKDDSKVRSGGSHGYFKDLLNILVLAANHSLDVNNNPHKILHVTNLYTKKRRCPYPPITAGKHSKMDTVSDLRSVEKCKQLAKDDRHQRETKNWNRALENLKEPFYRYLHATVARIFAEQLNLDMEYLQSGNPNRVEKITLAAKWAPSLQNFHDKHTLIATSIAEILFPRTIFDEKEDRSMYLKLAREAYRAKYLTPLRTYLDVVERKISKEMFGHINYSKVPSLAMNIYKNLFVRKDYDHFESYIENVAKGKSSISGAVLTPATIIHGVMESIHPATFKNASSAKELLEQKQAEILLKTDHGQWKSLVMRIKESGKLSSSIAVCDVSGSMYYPTFKDGTKPIDSAVGLSMLVAELTPEPFANRMITFSADPKLEKLLNPDTYLRDRVSAIIKYDWGQTTDFVAVFERLILPTAIKHKIPNSEMIKQVFVFSDMQFDAAQQSISTLPFGSASVSNWESSFERVKRLYQEAGYTLPQLVFWNLASQGGSASTHPVRKDECNTVLVSGYSQAMLKMFLDGDGFDQKDEASGKDDDEEEEIEEIGIGEKGEVTSKSLKSTTKKKKTIDPEAGMWKAIGHDAYRMLKIWD